MKASPPSLRPGKGLQSMTLAGLVVIIVVSGWILLSNIDLLEYQLNRFSDNSSTSLNNKHHNSNNDNGHLESKQQNNQHHEQPTITAADDDTTIPPPPLESVLDPNIPYITYLPFAGLTNQFIALESAAFAAKRLNRTLILPPIISNTHDHDNTHQSWSHFLDLSRFSSLTGVPVVEWDHIRPLTKLQREIGQEQTLFGFGSNHHKETARWQAMAENITCEIVYGYGAPDLDINISAQTFVWHFLLRPIFERPPPRKPETKVYDRTKVATDNTHEDDLVVMQDLVDRYRDWQGAPGKKINLLALTHTFKLRDPDFEDRYWNEIGQNLHFLPKVMEFATLRINKEVEQDQGIDVLENLDPEEEETESSLEAETEIEKEKQDHSEDPSNLMDTSDSAAEEYELIEAPSTRIPHIAIHIRRGDIWKKCSEAEKAKCVVPMEQYAEAVDRARAVAATRLGYGEDNKTQHHLPVIVTTDSSDPEDFEKIKAYGWHRLDHERYKTVALFGSFGPALIDAAILAHADVFIGSKASTMTKIAAMRQQAWYHRDTLYTKVPKAPAKAEGTTAQRRRTLSPPRRLTQE
ncbi:hypothetical protein BGZ83_009728 [Gryganskiella cystojenkinii]|nr:hypothetical protein BGZ83_009728 [Gryganskiella cystojenkinii]